MKLFKKMMSAVLLGVMALTMLAGCSWSDATAPDAPKPTDENEKGVYYLLASACRENQVKMPTYSEELSGIAEEYLDTYIAQKVTKPAISSTEASNRNKETNAKLFAMTTLNVVYPTPTMTSGPKRNVCALQPLTASERTTMLAGILDYSANYVGVSVKEVDGTKYMAIVYVKAETASAQPTGE